MTFLHTYWSHYILSVLFCSLLLTVVHLLRQINGSKKYAHCIVLCSLRTSGLYNVIGLNVKTWGLGGIVGNTLASHL